MSKYLLKTKLGTANQTFTLEDASGNTIYEAKMLKFSLFMASPFEFINHITHRREEHKIGKTITLEEGGNSLITVLSKKSYFKYDGKNIWDYLHDKDIRIDSKPYGEKIGMTHDVSREGLRIATISSSSLKGKSFITTDLYYDVTCEEKNLDIVFLIAFSIARTDQVIYN